MEPTFPVIVLKKGERLAYYFESRHALERTSRELLLSGVFNNCLIIDQNGDEYIVENAFEVGYANNFRGYSLIKKGTQIIVKFDLRLNHRYSLEELKEKLSSHAAFINESFATETTSSLETSKSFAEVIQAFK